MDNEARQPHPHASLIKAWAAGKTLQIYDRDSGKWTDYPGIPKSFFAEAPQEKPEWQYRIKPKEPEQWKPVSSEDCYYYVTLKCTVSCYTWNNDTIDNDLISVGNCFKTREEAEAAAERVKAALKGKESEEVKQGQWKPVLGETYFYLNDELSPSEEEWEDSNFDQYMFEHHNCFKTREECKAAAARVKAALEGKECEELKKLRQENEDLKIRNENLHKAKELAIKENEELKREIRTHDAVRGIINGVDGQALSDGELALIRAIRQTEVAYVWERNAAILVDKESFEARQDFIAFITCGSDNEDDEVRAALNKISREQEQEAAEQEGIAKT